MKHVPSGSLVAFALALLAPISSPCPAQQTDTRQQDAVDHSAKNQNMAKIAGATIRMGIDASEVPRLQKFFNVDGMELFEPEIPKHDATVDSFYIDRQLVTNSQFKEFVDANPSWAPDRISGSLHNGNYLRHSKPTGVPLGRENHPVVNVGWYAAVAYCQSLGKRLPTEAEWALAARGKQPMLFPWGDAPVDKLRANYWR